ncbi:MAG: hypothetical protein KDI36_10030 [Pseudomonadales bacterium]|nr:hypothetical protein [Pseudomonadales bacterium]
MNICPENIKEPVVSPVSDQQPCGPRMVRTWVSSACNDCQNHAEFLADTVGHSAAHLSSVAMARVKPRRLFNWITAALIASWIGMALVIAETAPRAEPGTAPYQAFVEGWL